MQCKRGFKKNPNPLVSIWQHDKGEDSKSPPSQVLQQARAVHNKGKDVMPPKLPPRRVLEQRAKPPKQEELQKNNKGRRNTKETTHATQVAEPPQTRNHMGTRRGPMANRGTSPKKQKRDSDEGAASIDGGGLSRAAQISRNRRLNLRTRVHLAKVRLDVECT
ncbi:hypothetical protein AB3S75_047189 [Citrus x aurantiifolia]